MGVLELIQQKSFIGLEFLTWLWFRTDAEGRIDLPGGGIEIEILGPITLEAHWGDARAAVFKGEAPTQSPEAHTALLEGKKLRKAKFKFVRGDEEWITTLDGETFNISGLNVPKAGKLPLGDQLALRMAFVQGFEETLGELFAAFMELRLDAGQWESEIEAIQTWAANE